MKPSSRVNAVFQVLRRGGRLVLRNLCPQECADWLYYAYFPEAYAIDLADFGRRRPWWRCWKQLALWR